jgi:hypothetical protein
VCHTVQGGVLYTEEVAGLSPALPTTLVSSASAWSVTECDALPTVWGDGVRVPEKESGATAQPLLPQDPLHGRLEHRVGVGAGEQ